MRDLPTTVSKDRPRHIVLILIAFIFTNASAFGAEDGPLLRRDLMNLMHAKNVGISIVGLGVAGIAHSWDDDLAGKVGDSRVTNEILGLASDPTAATSSLFRRDIRQCGCNDHGAGATIRSEGGDATLRLYRCGASGPNRSQPPFLF